MGPVSDDSSVVFDPSTGAFVPSAQLQSAGMPPGGLPGAGPGQVGPSQMHAAPQAQWAPGVSPTPTANMTPPPPPAAMPKASPGAPAAPAAPGAAQQPGWFTRVGNAFQGISPPATDTQHPGDNALAGASRGIQSAYQGISSLFS